MTEAHARPELLDAVHRLVGAHGAGAEPLLDPSRSATAMETVGRAAAEAVRPLRPEVLLTSEDSANAVLAHIVSRELGVPAVPFYVEEGVIEIDAALVRGRRVVLLLAKGVQPLRLSTMHSFAGTHHAELAGIAEVIGSAGAASEAPVPYVAVVDQAELAARGAGAVGGARDDEPGR
ncbi:hypothetical protein GCM10023085_07910 [Actinomadura viridis]|uniref:Uncharacterized protein n=1 Tax=Actinomadura viridis TaxID=58110 RepID=A0A931DQ91_9ACTN|nr:hypothetical protein [Actinomadura viridis]MBG6091801.1 hypothetical protein [Actinomadura viridis]